MRLVSEKYDFVADGSKCCGTTQFLYVSIPRKATILFCLYRNDTLFTVKDCSCICHVKHTLKNDFERSSFLSSFAATFLKNDLIITARLKEYL
ncbi:uncharacterized protein PHALS_15240 [Plasmopara halstedii]|uniref:Uncharacterized protein n=1 Tax=Plasmopara halstedii TaxID=4781 RepID=A0A0N7L8G7_PLAHL|nr:uncharacterized protein PHALS_15240 [Plasmopara halstedii]CEG49827.1 hypothetical protein PHALS_15240 [Plasmopara halstedii]|eukprot:XP_024586196.1 hypothetical protein PHALS_15240 [Plasmopara halstedii]